jgi:ADP-heptose:LPS heptosyltransferase
MIYITDDYTINVDFYKGAKVEISGTTTSEFEVFFIDNKTNNLIHSDTIKSGYWTKPSIEYFIEWKIIVMENGVGKVYEEILNLENKEVLIIIENTPLGDNIAWVEYISEFMKQHNCIVTFQTFFKSLFEESYPQLNIVKQFTHNFNDPKFYASYKLSVGFAKTLTTKLHDELIRKKLDFIPNLSMWNKNETPFNATLEPLQKFATNVLGLEWKEKRPNLICENNERPIQKKYICISEFASGKIKEWNNQIGWQTIVDELSKMGYEIVSISKEKSSLKRITKRNGDFSLNDRIWYLKHCEFFIGVSSGLAWLAWGCGKKVVMISGVTLPSNEFITDCVRIYNENACYGCWNRPEHADKFVVFNTKLCPENKNWECSRKISPKMVLEKIKNELIL